MPISSSKNYKLTLSVKSPNEVDYIYKGPGYNNAVLNDDELSPIVITCPAKLGGRTLSNYSVEIYPSPASNNLNIQLRDDTLQSIRIMNSLKQIVYSISTKNVTELVQIDVSKFPPGIYLAKFVKDNGEELIKKFVVIR